MFPGGSSGVCHQGPCGCRGRSAARTALPVVPGDRREVVAHACDGGIVVRGLVQELEGVLGGDGLAAVPAQVGFEGVAVAAVGVGVGAERGDDGGGGSAAEVEREPAPVDEAAVEPHELLGAGEVRCVEDVHGTDVTAAGSGRSCRKRTCGAGRGGPGHPSGGWPGPGVPRCGVRERAHGGVPCRAPGVNPGGTVADRPADHRGPAAACPVVRTVFTGASCVVCCPS